MGVQYYMPTYVSGLKWGCGHSAQKKSEGVDASAVPNEKDWFRDMKKIIL